jgi:hypothetical protein
MKIHIKNMVCGRCISSVNNIFKESGIEPVSVTLGEAEVQGEIENEKLLLITKRLKEVGFEIIENNKSRIIEKIKNVVIELVHHSDEELNVNFSDIIESKLNLNYNYLYKYDGGQVILLKLSKCFQIVNIICFSGRPGSGCTGNQTADRREC